MILVLLPAVGAAFFLTALTTSLRVTHHAGDPMWVAYSVLLDTTPGLLMIGVGFTLGSVCLLLASFDQPLSKMEARA